MFENVDGWMTDARVTGILIAHLGAFGSGELKMATNPELMRVKESVKEKFWNLSETSHILNLKSFRSMNTLKLSSKTCQNFFPNIKN